MKTKPAPKDITLIQLFDRFSTDDKARQHLEGILWKDGVVCPHCKCKDQTQFAARKANPEKKIRAGLRYCSNCKSQFTVTIGTIFEDSHIPLRKWLIAWYMICSSKKGISSLQLQRNLELGSYRSALFMAHRIRYALKDSIFADKLRGTVEADEGFIGGAPDKSDKRNELSGYRSNSNKIAVMALVERGGRVRSQVISSVNDQNLKQAIRENVERSSELHTDQNPAYVGLKFEYEHQSVKHRANEFSRRENGKLIGTTSVESFFSLLKRGVIGTFHHISAQRLPLYLAEFDHRHNCRKMTDGARTDDFRPFLTMFAA